MIEIEQKFSLSREEMARLLAGAEFTGKKIITDTYYDTASFTLTLQDIWLRERNGRFELKIPVHSHHRNSSVRQYQEISDERAIKSALRILGKSKLASLLAQEGYMPFCRCTTTRATYHYQDINIDVDDVNYGDVSYRLAEVEIIAANEQEAATAKKKLQSFIKNRKLSTKPVRGKVIEYLQQKRPLHYQALKEKGIVQ